jgi:hypothetical protein
MIFNWYENTKTKKVQKKKRQPKSCLGNFEKGIRLRKLILIQVLPNSFFESDSCFR